MNYKRAIPSSRIVKLFVGIFLLLLLTRAVSAQTQQLPLSTITDLFPPNFLVHYHWLDPTSGNQLAIDAYGRINDLLHLNLGTTVDGKVMVTDLGDGTQQVTLLLQTNDALCWGLNSNNQPAFGYAPLSVLSLGPAALGNSTTIIVKVQPTGPVTLGGTVVFEQTTVMCRGLLRAGSGYTEGTEGLAQTTQVGLYETGVPIGCPPETDADCFPAEKVTFRPLGN